MARWITLDFGKHKGKTLPHILCTDPDWFFWAFEKGVFNKSIRLSSEADVLRHKATHIKIPNNGNGGRMVEYVIHPPTGKFSHFKIVSSDDPEHEGSSTTVRSEFIDMSMPRKISQYDKTGCKSLLKSFKYYLFGKESARLTKKRCEEFFNDSSNFA